MTDTEEEKHTLTALDYIEKQERLEKEAQSILPGKFEKCTFPLGYVRQALYACKTCSSENEDAEPAGMCYSCSIACHSSHELFELFPKRAFRCDCGLQNKFGGHECSLMIPAKKIVKINDKNEYNHNFEGRYCRCVILYIIHDIYIYSIIN
jgi:E3 ubiquitin-protein ligase UBR7